MLLLVFMLVLALMLQIWMRCQQPAKGRPLQRVFLQTVTQKFLKQQRKHKWTQKL